MTAATTSSSQATASAAPASALRAVPIAVWALVGGLALATAGLIGALVMRSADPAPMPSPVAAQPATTDKLALAAPAPTTSTSQQQAGTQVQAAHAEAARPAPQRAPKPAPSKPVQVAQGNASAQSAPVPLETQRAAVTVCSTCGTVESVQAVQEKGEGSGLGAVAGGVLGGVVGHQFGGGNGRTALTVIGAAGGALAGHEVEKRARASTSYDVRVRMEDGSVRSFRQGGSIAVGTRVTVEGNTLRVGAQQPSADSNAPRTLRTSAPAGTGA